MNLPYSCAKNGSEKTSFFLQLIDIFTIVNILISWEPISKEATAKKDLPRAGQMCQMNNKFNSPKLW